MVYASNEWSVYDNGIHCSTLVRWPNKVKPGSNSMALIQYVDVAPTFLAAGGIDSVTIDVNCLDANGNKGFDGRRHGDRVARQYPSRQER